MGGGDMTMQTTALTSGRPEAVIDLGAIAHNVRVLCELAGPAQVMAVVKADGYGHGAGPVGQAAIEAGAAELGVATIDEALTLRSEGISAPILAWLHPPGTDFAPAVNADIQIGVSSVKQVSELLDATHRTGRTASVTVKVDTGLNRNGVSPADYPGVLTQLQRGVADGALRLRGIMSHLVSGDEPDDPINDIQAERLTEMIDEAKRRGIKFEIAHLSNSPSAMTRPDLGFDMVRPGIAVYGLSPLPVRGDMGLRPAMTLKCQVAMVKPIQAGEGVSYGHKWIAERDTVLALLPIGYADGVYRALSGRIDVLINGRLRRSVGRVCMDQFVVDLGPGEADVTEGDDAILFGPGASGESTAQDWADLLDTIHYEVVTNPRGRVTRRYRKADTSGR
jgi:alanine racemase